MSGSPLSKKLGIKAGARVLIMNAPEGYMEMLGVLPEGVEVETQTHGMFDLVQVFMRDKADVNNYAMGAIRSLRPGGVLWFSFPKKSSKVKTDITRDVGWDVVTGAGMEGVATVAIDETWSGLRFRPSGDVRPRKA